MTEGFILTLVAMIFSFISVLFTLFYVCRKLITDKYIKESKKLQLLYNNLKREYGDLVDEPSDFLGGALNTMGVDGILDSLGIPSAFKPLAKGFIDNILSNPKKMKALADKFGFKLESKQDDTSGGVSSQV